MEGSGRTTASGAADERLLGALAEVAEAVESGAGVPEVVRSGSRALNAGLAVLDSASNVLAVAAASPSDEREILAGADDAERHDLRVAGSVVGELRMLPRATRPPPVVVAATLGDAVPTRSLAS